jgi:membrane-associated phospholipid phosphatase
MHWLLSIDHALFHFINSSLSNPFFDWLMPILSGHGVPWLPVVIIGLPVAFCRGSTRLRLCLVFALLVVALGDPLIIGTIKSAVERGRPCVSMPDDIVRLACGGYHSFPSAHAANTFAVAMVAFLFYRRSAWCMFPFAAAVSFSRVYCGVHFPIDVTAGAILGMGYAIAFIIATQAAWNFIGPKFSPAWHAQLPDLANPKSSTINSQPSTSGVEWLNLSYIVIVLALIARWTYIHAGIINLSGDEAYQWLWSKHLALSYYSKPFGIALIQWFGTAIGGDTEFGVRFCSPLFAAILSIFVLRFLARETSPRTAFFMLLATLATPLLDVGSILMTIDPPLVLCWMWAVLAGWRALQPEGKTRDWLVVGLAVGLGFLSKYTAALEIVCFMIFFALHAPARVHLRKPGPWLALGVFALCTLPVLIWNSQHSWVTIDHVAGNAQLGKKWEPTLKYFGEFLGGQAGLLNPVFFFAALWAGFGAWKHRAEKPLWFYFFCLGAPLFYGYWLYSLHSRVQPNWPVAAVPPMFCLMALYWHERPREAARLFVAGLMVGIPIVALLHSSSLTRLLVARLPGDVDIAHRTYGWRETALVVESERAKFDPSSFIIADGYQDPGLFTFYSPAARAAISQPNPLVYPLDSDKPANQFFFWDEYNYRKHRRGDNAIYVTEVDYYKLEHGWLWKWLHHQPLSYRDIPPLDPPPKRLTSEFESVTNLGVREIKINDGRIFHRIQIFGCYHLK